MNVFCGFTDPIFCPHLQTSHFQGEAEYEQYVSRDIFPVGKIVFHTTIDSRQFGITNDGCFFIEHDWDQGTPVVDIEYFMMFLTRNLIYPIQRMDYLRPLKQLEAVQIHRGVIASDIVTKTIIDNRRPTGSFEVNRYETREYLNNAISYGIKMDTSSKAYFGINYPSMNFLPVHEFKKAFDEAQNLYLTHTNVRWDLLSYYLSHASNADFQQAYYFGALYLEDLAGIIIQNKTPQWLVDNTRPTLGQKLAHIRDNALVTYPTIQDDTKAVNQKRIDVFHHGIAATMTDVFLLQETIDKFNNELGFSPCPGFRIHVKSL